MFGAKTTTDDTKATAPVEKTALVEQVEYCAKCGTEAPAGWSENCGGCGNPFVAHPDPAKLFATDPGPVPEDDITREIEAVRGQDLAAAIAGVKSAVEGAHKRLDELTAPDGDRVAALAQHVDDVLITHQEGISAALHAHSEQAAKISEDVDSLTIAIGNYRDQLKALTERTVSLEEAAKKRGRKR